MRVPGLLSARLGGMAIEENRKHHRLPAVHHIAEPAGPAALGGPATGFW